MADLIFFTSEEQFTDWFEVNPSAQELWVGYYKKDTGLAGLTWSSSVDVALCFGWIDGIRKTVDDKRFKIRFTPRKIDSVWSAVNVKKVQELISLGRMTSQGLHLYNHRRDKQGYSADDRNIPLNAEYEALIKSNPVAWSFLSNLAPSYRRDSIWWVMSAKREETRLKRLGILIESCEAGEKIPNLR